MNIALLIGVFSIILLIYGGLTYYIGIAGWNFITAIGLNIPLLLYWIILWIVALSFFIARGAAKRLPNPVAHSLELIGAYWLGIFTYLTLFLMIGRIILRLNTKFQFVPVGILNHPRFSIITGFILIIFLLIIIVMGSWNARNPQIVEYEVVLNKKTVEFEELNVVMLSDIHLGRLVNKKQLEKIVKKINALDPDIILLPGDIIDDRIDAFIEQDMMSVLQNLNSTYGAFASLGNHEYIGGQVEKAVEYLKYAGIVVLRDEYIMIDDKFYLVGREDKSIQRLQGRPRKTLEEILQGVNINKPIIMLDHQPVGIHEAIRAGVDIQLSGHTHRGQLFPFRIFTKKIFQVDWGHEKIGDYHIIVSSGAGTWGPPLRVGHRSEILSIKVK